ncbi:class I SAM-dependent methyltransferase [archaeon]|jgi:ubiquinone/menaquinone biosynthesis C-methylase UbiE|nr:class I SAM-dependent methyltransferase [archaeon]MBT6824441.1 class I SAM-dependent methyltransferase [archaeon]MBT7107281.1 class I SAM-dependent methyltransferase [archaeon]MBT7297416.1 class I SAM-dependent methyltransferase [archaeon]
MNYYDHIAEGYNELHKEEQIKKVNLIIKLLNIDSESVLDVGCGTAFYSELFVDYTGIDNSKGMIDLSKANVVLGDAADLPFDDNSFDCVISVTALQNVKDYKEAISEIKRIAKNKIAISILKKSENLKNIRNLLSDFESFEEDKDIIFYKLVEHSE